jgi:hypothetical protein
MIVLYELRIILDLLCTCSAQIAPLPGQGGHATAPDVRGAWRTVLSRESVEPYVSFSSLLILSGTLSHPAHCDQ